MSSFWVETIFVSCVIDCIRYTIITCEWVWASLYKICPVGATLPQFTGFVSLNVIAGWISRIGALKEIINNYSISSPNYQFRFLTKVYFHNKLIDIFNFTEVTTHIHILWQLYTNTVRYPHILFIIWYVHVFYLAWKSPTPMLLFSLVRTTAADSCGAGNATAMATTDAKIMIVFILLIGWCILVCRWSIPRKRLVCSLENS